jgi:hypothetical protein
MERRGQRYLLGVGFVQSSATTVKTLVPLVPVDTSRVSLVPQSVPEKSGTNVGTSKTLTQSGGTNGTSFFSPFTEICNLLSQLTEDERQKMADLLTGVPCSDPIKAFRVGDKVAGNKPDDASYNWHGRIVEIHTSISCKVDWQEREGMRGGRVISMLFCNLRKIK